MINGGESAKKRFPNQMVYLTDPQTNKELTKLFKPKTHNKNMLGKIKGMNERANKVLNEVAMAENEKTEAKEEAEKVPDPVEEGAKEAEAETSETSETSDTEETSEEKPAE